MTFSRKQVKQGSTQSTSKDNPLVGLEISYLSLKGYNADKLRKLFVLKKSFKKQVGKTDDREKVSAGQKGAFAFFALELRKEKKLG